MDTKTSRSNKRKGRDAEIRAAAIYGTERWLANTGGKEDLHVLSNGVHVQVKAGATVTMGTILTGLDAARAVAPAGHIGACHVEYHRAGKRDHRKIIVFDAAEWAAREGLPRNENSSG